MNNIDDSLEVEANIGEDTFTCPKCGNPQTYFINRGHGWVRCPECDTGVQKRSIPEDYHHLIKKVEYKKKEEKKVDVATPPKADVPVVKTVVPAPVQQAVAPTDEIFDRPMTDHEVLGQVLDQFGIPKNVRDFMVKRAERQGTMHPQEVQRILGDMKTNMPKKQLSYVAEEYYLALEAEQEKRQRDAMTPSYPMRRSTYDSGALSYPWRRGGQTPDGSGGTPTWDRGRGPPPDVMTPADFEREWDRRVEKLKQSERIEEQNKTITELGNMIQGLQHQISDPPKKDDSDKFYKMFIDQERASNDKLMTLIKEMQDQREAHSKEIIEVYKTQATRSSTEGYKEDTTRLLADGVNALTSVIEKNKPLHTAVKTISQSQGQPQQSEPVDIALADDGDVGILSKLPKRLVEED